VFERYSTQPVLIKNNLQALIFLTI